MKILRLVTLLLIVLSMASCSKESNINKIPGSFKALELFNYQRAYPNPMIPDGAYSKAFEHHEQRFLQQTKNRHNITPMGPLNTTGRTLTVAVNPQADRTIYAGSASGGLWRSRSLGMGQSWEYVETGFPVLGVSTIEFAPQDSMVMYIGTGEVYNFFDTGTDGAYRSTRGSYGIGILKSEDGGQTWKKSLDWTYNQKHGVWMIKVSPTNPDIVYAATTEGIFKSIDAGESWSLVFDVIMATDIEIDPRDPNNVIASFGNFGSARRGIYTTLDGGDSWTQVVPDSFIEEFQGKIQLARAPSNPDKLYASVGNGFSDADGRTRLYLSLDNGVVWERVNTTDYSRWQGWFSHDVAVNPNNEEQLVAVGIGVHRSLDEGRTLELRNEDGVTRGLPPVDGPDGPPDYVHSDIHFVKYHPSIEDLVILGTDGGVFLSFDNATTFMSANGGMQTTQFYNGFSVSHTDPNIALGGLQDNSTVVFRGDEAWRRSGFGDGSWTAIDQQRPGVVYMSAQGLVIFSYSDGGINVDRFIDPVTEPDDNPLFIAPYVLSDQFSSVSYSGSEYVYKSEDFFESFNTMNGGNKIDKGNRVFAMDVHNIPEIACVATVPEVEQGKFLMTFDGGDTWSGGNSGLPDRVPNDVVISDENPNLAFVCYSGFGTSHLFMTTDAAESWTVIDDGLPDVPGNAIAIDEEHGVIYYGTDIAVYSAFYKDSNNRLLEEIDWQLYSEGMPLAAIIMDLKISPSDQRLWIATHGNGAYRGDLINDIFSSTNEEVSSDLRVYPNPTDSRLFLDGPKVETWLISNNLGQTVLHGSRTPIDMSSLPAGVYNLSVTSQNKMLTKKIIKQ